MIYDPSNGITYITVLGGVFHPADGQYLLYNTYRNSPSPDIFFNNVMLAEKVSDADDARIFNNRGSVPAYSVYITDSFERYVALNTIPFKDQNYEPSVIYLQPNENSELSVMTNDSIYLRGLDIYVRNIGDKQYPAAPVYSENGGKETFSWNGLSGAPDSSKRVLKLVFRYSYEGYEWTNERELYVITSKAGTEEEPEIVYNYDGLRRALADPIVRYISTDDTCNAILEAADPGLVKNAVDRYRATGDITELDDTIKEFGYCKTENVDVLRFLGYGLSNSALTTVGAKHLELNGDLRLYTEAVVAAVNHDWQEEGALYGIDLYNSDLSISGTGMIIWQGNSKADKALSA
ncbi:MAG: hypothetical protein K5686_04030, partial [Lachnospiraceae bacterium]|nr:hypothetical protein [Lachnospiraceae bacterium]